MHSTKRPTSPQLTKATKRQKKDQHEDQLIEKALAYLDSAANSTEKVDEYDLFGKHVAAELKSTKSIEARRWAKLQIQTIIFHAQSGIANHTTYGMSSTHSSLHQSRDATPLSSYSDDGLSFGSGLSSYD